MTRENAPKPALLFKNIIIAIGALEGSYSHLELFFNKLPADRDFSFIILGLLTREQQDSLIQIIRQKAGMQVKEIKNMTKIEPSVVYFSGPENKIYLSESYFHLKNEPGLNVTESISYLYESLHNCLHHFPVGIIFSADGNGMVSGIKEIRTSTEISLENLIPSGYENRQKKLGDLADVWLDPEQIPEQLTYYLSYVKNHEKELIFKVPEAPAMLRKIFKLIYKYTKHDFSDYKKNTILRRLERRMNACHCSSLADYISLLEEDPEEIKILFSDFLIGVTEFFRNPEAFQSLEKIVFPSVFSETGNNPVRIWIPACSTGEEAYSIAILIHRYLHDRAIKKDVQIFASDIDLKSLEKARSGRYLQQFVSGIPADILNRYFIPDGKEYQVIKPVREMIIFASHNVLSGTPFSRLDLISCRNFLIYLNQDIQKQILDTFHFSLNHDGFLFLGNSEIIGTNDFQVIDSKWKIFQKINSKKPSFEFINNRLKNIKDSDETAKNILPEVSIKEFAEKTALQKYMHPLLIINYEGDIMYSLGDCHPYFVFSADKNIVRAAKEELKIPLAAALRKLKKERSPVEYHEIAISGKNNEPGRITLKIQPIDHPSSLKNYLTVTIMPFYGHSHSPVKKSKGKTDDYREYTREIEEKLEKSQQNLQSVMQEFGLLNEELKSSSEEKKLMVDELRKSNEELETSKEELQLLNEELENSNMELRGKVEEIFLAKNDIENLISNTRTGILFLSNELTIQMFTPFSKKIFNFNEEDKGKHISEIVNNLNYTAFIDDVRQVLTTGMVKETETENNRGELFILRILPYITREKKKNGIVISFTEVTEQREMQNRVKENENRYRILFENMLNAMVIFDLLFANGVPVDAVLTNANKSFYAFTGINETVTGKKFTEVFTDTGNLSKYIQTALSGEPFISVEYMTQFDRFFKINCFSPQKKQFALVLNNITDLLRTQEQIKSDKEKFSGIFNNLPIGVSLFNIVKEESALQHNLVFIDVNPAFEKLTGFSKEELTGKPVSGFFKKVSNGFMQKLLLIAETKETLILEEYSPSIQKYLKIFAFSPARGQIAVVFIDMTEEKKLREENEEKEKRYRELFDNMDNGFGYFKILHDDQNRPVDSLIVEMNESAEKHTGIKSKEVIGKKLSEFLPASDDLKKFIHTASDVAQTGIPVEIEQYNTFLQKHFRIYLFSFKKDFFAAIINNITDYKNEMEARQHLASIVESSDDTIFSISLSGKILSWNEGARQLYGYESEDILGRHVSVLSASPEKKLDDLLIGKVIRGEKVKNYELFHKSKSGKIIPVSITKSPVYDQHKKLTGISNIIKDITLQKRREKELVKAKEEAERAVSFRTTFLENISHEIRTPMNSILGFTELMLQSAKTEEFRHQMKVIYQSGNQLLNLINDIMDISRLEAGEIILKSDEFNLNDLLIQLKEQFEGIRLQSDNRNLDFILSIPSVPLIITTDKYRLRQVLTNLLGNAFKYTEEGTIEYGYQLKGEEIEFFVKDTGVGISDSDRRLLFKRFKQIPGSVKKPVTGSGLGLSISKGLVEILGGSIWFDSVPGKGSSFYFTIPCKFGTKADLNGETETDHIVPDLNNKSILLAEDDTFSALMLEEMLKDTRVRLISAKDGKETITMFSEYKPDLVLLDIHLPKMNGYEVLKKIKKKNPDIPVIAQTAYAMPDDMEKYKKAGFSEHLIKPIRLNNLYTILNKYLSEK